MTLHEVAKELGVETRVYLSLMNGEIYRDKTDLEIAHEVLAKLPDYCYPVRRTNSDKYSAVYLLRPIHKGTFIECVIALAERYIKEMGA